MQIAVLVQTACPLTLHRELSLGLLLEYRPLSFTHKHLQNPNVATWRSLRPISRASQGVFMTGIMADV